MDTILVVDDETNVRSSFEKLLKGPERRIITAQRADIALQLLETEAPDILIMDIFLPGMTGMDAFRQIKERFPMLPVIIMTGFGTTELAIEATKLGAFDYQLKPFDPGEMLQLIEKALANVRLMQRQVEFNPRIASEDSDALIGQSASMREVYKTIGRVAQTDASVLIRGETGTGKELVARAIYLHSLRNRAPLLAINCTAIPETLLESELFGYEKGAFTGAQARRIGKFEQVDGGTILLDEIGDIPLSTQAKLLRFLQERTFERIGGMESIQVDVRLLAATNRDLEKAIAEKAFREDLYHRLNVVTINIPPLRERREDIPELIDYYMARIARDLHIEEPPMAAEARRILCDHPWPGNVRELEHCLHRLCIFTRGYSVQIDDVQRALETPSDTAASGELGDELRSIAQRYLQHRAGPNVHEQFMSSADRLLVTEALRLSEGNQTRAARLLGLTRPTLQAKMQKYGISRGVTVREEEGDT